MIVLIRWPEGGNRGVVVLTKGGFCCFVVLLYLLFLVGCRTVLGVGCALIVVFWGVNKQGLSAKVNLTLG